MKVFLPCFCLCVVLVVMMMGKWSEESFLAVLQRVSIVSAGVQKVMSGEDILCPAWSGLCVHSVRLLSMDRCCSSCSMCVPLVFTILFSYHAVLLPLKTPRMIRLGICMIWCSGGKYPLGIDSFGGCKCC